MKKLFVFFTVLLFTVSCGKQELMHAFVFDKGYWEKFDNRNFSLNGFNSEKPYSIVLELAISDDFKSNTFDFQLLIEDGEGELWNKVFSVRLTDYDGSYLPVKEKDNLYHLKTVLVKHKYFRKDTSYKFTVVNLNRKLKSYGVYGMRFVFKQ